MTRFARAKGSKSSNEKVPENPTPWSELKKGMLMKQEALSEETKKCVSALKSRIQEEKPAEWVSLDDENDDSLNVLKKHLKERKKAKNNLTCASESSASVEKSKVKERKRKETENVDSQVQKKKKKNDKFQVGSTVMLEKPKKKDKTSKKALQVAEEDESSLKVLKKKNVDVKDDTKAGKKKRKKLDVPEIESSVESNQNVVKKKSKKNTKKSYQNFVNNIDGNESTAETLTGKEKIKTFAGKKSLKKNRTTTNNDKSNKANKLKNPKKKNKFNPDKLTININGQMVDLVKFQGFYITKEDGDRLNELRKKMVAEGIPENQIAGAIKLERRRCEKALSRMKKQVCFQCRKSGHQLSECPEMQNNVDTSTGVCYKCGSAEHKAFACRVTQGKAYPFAECFICKEKGHIARECPDNPRGLYPKGGCCKICGDVTHLKKDCPKRISETEEKTIKLAVRDDRNVEGLDDGSFKAETVNSKKQKKKPVRY